MEKGIAEFIRLFGEENTAILQDATTRVSNNLVRNSVVKTGEMVSDWDAAVGDWPANVQRPPDPKRSATRARLKEAFKSAKMGDAIFFQNDDPAAVQQEIGHWKSAPNGLTRLTSRKWNSFVRGASIAAKNRVTGGGKRGLVFD